MLRLCSQLCSRTFRKTKFENAKSNPLFHFAQCCLSSKEISGSATRQLKQTRSASLICTKNESKCSLAIAQSDAAGSNLYRKPQPRTTPVCVGWSRMVSRRTRTDPERGGWFIARDVTIVRAGYVAFTMDRSLQTKMTNISGYAEKRTRASVGNREEGDGGDV